MRSFASLIAPVSAEQFFAEYWERNSLVVPRRDVSFYRDVLSLDDVDHALTTLNLHYPEIRVARGSEPPKAEDFTLPDGRIDTVALIKHFVDGTTLILDNMQQRIPQLGRLCGDLERELGVAFHTNLYLTPPGSRGFKVHYDTHDVFILQVAGSKHWELFDSPIELPMPGQIHDQSGVAPGASTLNFTLHAGDLAYVPRGVYHEAKSGDALSLHITLGAITRSWGEFLIETLSEVFLRDAEFRRALPVGFSLPAHDHRAASAEFRRLWTRLAGKLDFGAVASSFVKEFARRHDPELSGQLSQIIQLERLTPQSVVVLRDGLIPIVEKDANSLTIRIRNTATSLPPHAEESIRAVLRAQPIRIVDMPGALDVDGKLILARRMIKEGLLRVAEPDP